MLELTDDVRQGLAKTAGHGALSFNTEEYAKAIDLKNTADNSFNVRDLPGGTFGQSVIDSALGTAGNIDDFLGGPTGLGDYANNYVTAQEMAMGEKPEADFSWDYLINGLPRDTGNLIGSGIGLAAPIAAATLAAPFVGVGATAAGIGGALAGAGLESMAEGGQKMRDSLANGDSLETAQDKARTVAGENMALLAPTNILGLGALKKVGQGLKTAYNGGKAVSATGGALANYPKLSQAVDFAKGAGWAGLGAMNEGAQEAWQQGIQDSVEPDTDWGILPWNWNDEQTEAFESTIGPTALMAGAGGGARLAARKLGMSDVPQVDTAPQVNNNLFGAGTAEISTQGADIDEQVAHLKDGYQSVIPQVAGVLVNDFGIEGAQISSAFRTREHNKEVGGVENSYHVGDGEHGDALDIVLPDGTSAETAEAIKQRFENSGVFDEVLFHDAGSGYHLHLGGLKTDNIGNSYGSYSGDADVDSAINEMAEKYNLDPALLAAMAEQESGFNQSAQSEAGAMGIMQLMPGTAEGLGVDPSDLRGNLEGGAKYLRQMLDKYNGDVEKALAAYNAGPGSLDSVNGDISKLSGETQKYVPSVMERYNKFKNKSGGGISSSGNILDWDSTNEDFSKLDFFPKDGEQSQGTANEFLENLAKLEESDDKATKEKGRQAQDILQQYGDDTEKLTEKAKELGYQQTVNPAEVHGRIPMRRIVSTALNNGQVTFATKKAADIFASSPIGQTMERQGKTFKVTDNFKMNEQVNAISQQVYSDNTARTKTVKNGVMADAAAANRELNGQARPPIQQNDSVLTDEDRGRLISVMPNLPPQVQQQIQEALAENDIKSVRQLLDEATNSTPLNAETDIEKAKAITRALLQNPEATTSWDGNGAVRTAAIEGFINSNNLDGLNRANKYMAQNLRDKGINPLEVLNQNIEKPNTLPAVQGERMPSTDVQREEPAIEGIEGTVEDTVITPPYNGKPAYNENQLEAPAIESDHLNSEDFLAGLSPVERGFMEYLDKMFDNLQLGFNDVLEYLRARQKDIFNKRMESVIQQGPQGLTGAFYTNGGKMVVDNNMPQEVQNAWNQLLSMRKNFGASLANSTTEIQNEYLRVESVVKDYLTTTVTEQCKNNVSWRKLNYAITGLEAIADKARRYERSVSEEGKRGSTKSYRDISAEEGQAIEDSAVAWSGAIHQYGTTETRLRSFLNTLGSNFTKNNHGMALRAKTKYKGQPMNKAGRIEALIRDGGRVEERGKEYFAVAPNGNEVKVNKGEHNYYKWLRQNGFAQQDRAPEGAPQLAKNNGVTEDSYRTYQPEYNGEESHEEYVKKEESTKGQTKPQSNDNPNASNEPMRKELIEQAAANEDTWVNSKKSELHLEDDNDTVVKLTPQELKYYRELVKKGVVAKPELYEETQEDVGEMDDNVEMSKEQKQLYDESNGDRDVPDSDSEPHTSGKSTKVVTADGKEYNVHYEVRPESKITASNNLDGSVNKDYPSELQPRNRQRVGNLTQVAEIAGKLRPADLAENRMLNHGAPLIREDGVVLNGNGRIMAIRTAVKNGTDHGYKQYLIDHAEELGLNPDNIEHMENPVLVKVVDDELTADDVKAITTDTSGGQRMSASEQAKTDAKKIKPSTLNMYQPNESGELMGNNKYFLSKLLEDILPADERNAYYTEDGSISKDGLMRAQRALFALAYGNDKLIDTFAETTNEQAKNLINALNANAATIAKLQRMIENGNAHDLKLRDNLVNAINALRSAVLDGKPAERIWKETSMFEEAELTPETKALAKAMDGFRKSGKKLTNFIAQLADNNLRHGDPKQETMFKGTDDFSLMKDIASAKDKIANGGQANIFEEPRAKYSREKSPVDEKNNQQENVTIEFEADTPAAQKVFDEQLTDEVKRNLRNTIAQQMTDTIKDFDALSDDVKADRAFSDLPIAKAMRVTYQIKLIQNNENNKSKIAARYEYARRCFLYDERVPNGINRPTAGNKQQKQMAGNLQEDVSKRNQRADGQRFANDVRSGSATPSLGEYKFIKKQFDKLVDDKLKHSSRDKSAFSIEPINPHSAESLKENGNSNTELDRLPKVPIAKLRQSEQKIVRFGKAIGVPVHFVESSDTTNRGVFTHNGEIFINRKAKVPAHSIFVHEFVHWLKASPENAGAYDVLHACLENYSGLFNEARINKYRNKIFDGEKMTDEEIVEEIICDAMTHTESAEKLMRAVNNVDGDLATRIAGCLKAMWDKFCKAIGFNPKILSRKQQLPNELSVTELQRADIAFNKILMNIKGNDGKPVFYRKGTELVLRETNAKPVNTYQVNPIGYTYAFASADNNPDRISPREQDSKYMSAVKVYQNESDPAKKESMLDKIRDMVQQAAKTAGFENAIPEQTRAYTVRTKPAPKKTMKVYKVFTVDDKGRPSALFVSSKDTLPQNVWLDANDTFAFTDNNNGRKYIPSTKNPNSKGGATGDSRKTENISAEELAKLEELGYIKRNKQGQYPKTITALAYRPGWHAGDLPFFPQGGKQGDGTTNYKNIHRYNQVVFECEIAYDKDYTNSTINKKGQIVYSDRQEMPTDGGYKFATNPMTSQNDLGNWYISGSLKIGRALTEEECNKILAKNGFKPQEWQAYGSGNDFVLGKLDLEKLGYTGEEFDAARKTLAPITYDDNGNIIPLSQRFNPNINDVRYSRELKHSKQSAFLMPENGKPYTMSYYHNTQPSPKMAGDMFAQSIEPSGEYIAHDTMNGSNQIPGFEYGKISFKSPLVLEHKSTGHGGWKTDLSNMFGGKKGKALSNAIKKAGHDGIITIDSKTGEILETVNLAGTKNNGNKYSRGVDLSPSTDGVAIAARANNNLVANMKGLVKKANAKFNPFHHEELENLRIDKRDEEKDLNLIEYQFVSPTRESKKYKVIQPFVMKGKQAMAKQEKLRFEFNEGMNEVDKLLGWREGFHRNDSKFKERKEALNEILLKGDLERKDFTNKELIEAGYDAETIKGYHKMRALLDKAWKLADETKSRIKYQSITSSTLRRAEADFADLKDKNPFAEIISKVHNPDGTVTINYKAPHVRRAAKQTVLPSELENLRKNKDVHIVETTQSLKGTTQVTYYQREAGMGKLKGYIPHVFHGWYVCKVDKDGKAIVDEDGNVAMDNIVTTANSLSEAAKLGRELAKENPNANYRVVPQTFSAPGAQEQAIVMGDFDYAKIVGQVADSMSMSITDAQAMLDNTVKMKNRGRFYGYAKQRKGFKGFEQNVYLATMKYFNQTARYAAMDSFKRDSISMYNRIFGAFDDENVTKRSAMAKWTKQYISDMNGTPTWIEKMINNTLHNFGLGEERAGGRPALWLQQKIFTYPMTILKLGVFNPSSALLNLTQLFNLYGAMGEKVLSPQAYQRLLHKGFADTFRAMSNKDSELGKLLWKDLGLDYQIGMDVASGYSNAEVNNLASLRGFAGRLAGKSMYLFRQSDAFARGVTLLTAYNKALDEGKSKAEAIEYAKEINDKVNFDYSVADEPTIFRALGPISKVFLQFKKYPVKQLELFQDFYLDGRELGLNRKQSFLRMVKYVAPYMAMSGMMGIPFVSFLGGLISYGASMIYGDDDWDWEKKIKQLMITEFGEDSPITQWWLYGAGSFIGLNLGGRVGVGDFLGPDSYNSADGLLGLAVNQTTLGSTIQQVSKQLSYRNYAEALKAINPTIGNIALAYKGEVRTTRGRMKYQYQNMAERMWRAIGFTPLNETLAGDLASNEYAEKQEQTKAKQEAIDDFLADPSSENAARLNELGVTPKSLENESARRTMNRHQLNELAKEKEAAKKKKKPKTYSASDYLKAVQ